MSTTTCCPLPWTSPTPPQPRRRSPPASSGSPGSTCWSTTPALPRGVLRRDGARGVPIADRDLPVRSGQRHPRRTAAAARAALRARDDNLLHRRHHLQGGVHHRLRPSKFGVEGFMEALAPKVAPLGIRTMLVEPWLFCTDSSTPQSTQSTPSPPSRTTHSARRRPSRRGGAWTASRAVTPTKLADALVMLAALEDPPLRFRRRFRRRGRLEGQGRQTACPGRSASRAVLPPRPRRRLTMPPSFPPGCQASAIRKSGTVDRRRLDARRRQALGRGSLPEGSTPWGQPRIRRAGRTGLCYVPMMVNVGDVIETPAGDQPGRPFAASS